MAQERIVTGKVKDPRGNPLPGVNVNVFGSRQSVTADVTGSFTIPVSNDNTTLVFSFVGFLQKEVKVADQNELAVTLAYDNADLDQVVVVGYGTQKRRDLIGSVYSVKPGTVTATPTFNALEALQGRVPGMDINRTGGQAGAGVLTMVRGQRTFSASAELQQPLYVIDGFQGGNIADLNPNDIESVEVLKDASATAIYGWMGANGVIIVTTKKGKDRPKVSYSGYYGVNGYTNFPKGRLGDDYVNLRREAYRTQFDKYPDNNELLFGDAYELDAYKKGQWVDWFDLVNQNGTQQSHSASIQSGGDKTKVFFSTGYYKEEGMLRGNDFTRYNARLNFDQRISNVFKAGLLSQVVHTKDNRRYDPLSHILTLSPLGVPFDDFGRINVYPIQNGKVSPLADEVPNAFKDQLLRTTVTANGYLEITPLTGLSFRSNLGTTMTFDRRGIYQDSLSLQRRNAVQPSYASQSTSFTRFYNWDNVLTYTKKIADHTVTLTALTSYTRSDKDELSANGLRQLLSSYAFYNLSGTEQNTRGISSGMEQTTSLSYAGRLNYSFRGKYLVTASLRADGVSRLAPGNKWDYFPSAGLGWNVHQEDFMTGLDFVNNLKLRATYGVAGNASIPAYRTQALLRTNIESGAYSQNFGDVPAPAYYFTGDVANPLLTWEKTATTNYAVDFAFFKSRLFGTVEAYTAKTTDILYQRLLPQSTGVASIWENIGATQNKGVEAAVSVVPVATPDLRWTSTVTYTAGREKITKLVNDKNIINGERASLLLGHPIQSWYTFQKLGIWQTDEVAKAAVLKFNGQPFKAGDIKLADLNGDSIINDNFDRTFVGTTVPKWFAGWQNTVTFKGLELSVYLFARWGQTIDAKFMGRYNPNGLGNGPAAFSYWTPENATNDFPRPRNATITQIPGYQSLNFIDGSYLKVKTVTLAYTLPTWISKSIYTDKLRIYATGNNLYTFAKSNLLKDYDPERGGEESSPLSKQVVIGVNVDF